MTDLMPCPVCGSDSCNVPDSYEGTVNCHGPTCCYGVWTEEEHNALARRAEIGRIVERIATERVGVTVTKIENWCAETMAASCEGVTLLDALRSLEKEVCGDD